MKKLRYLILFFALSAIALSCACSAMVAYTYCSMRYAILYEGASAPASTAFLYLIPFVPAIIICTVCAFHFHKKYVEKRKAKWQRS